MQRWGLLLLLVLLAGLAGGCATPMGLAYNELFVNTKLSEEDLHGEKTYVLKVPLVKQKSGACCGLAALAMVMDYWTEKPVYAKKFEEMDCPPKGFTGAALKAISKTNGFEAVTYQGSLPDLFKHLTATRPLIVMLKTYTARHYVVVIGHSDEGRLVINDPIKGTIFFGMEDFLSRWKGANRFTMLVVQKS